MVINMDKSRIKIVIDITMSIALFVVMSYQFTNQKNHEIAGAVMMLLFILHHIMNYKWYFTLGKGEYTRQRVLLVSVNLLLILVMLGVMISGIGMSRYVFRFLNFDMSMTLARNMHMICSYACFLLVGIHIGLHYGMILGRVQKALHRNAVNQKLDKRSIWIGRTAACTISVYGMTALVRRNFMSYMTLRVHFVFFDYEEPILCYELDLLAITVLLVFTGYYLQKLIIYLQRRKAGF